MTLLEGYTVPNMIKAIEDEAKRLVNEDYLNYIQQD